jgi:hypothetical protein
VRFPFSPNILTCYFRMMVEFGLPFDAVADMGQDFQLCDGDATDTPDRKWLSRYPSCATSGALV